MRRAAPVISATRASGTGTGTGFDCPAWPASIREMSEEAVIYNAGMNPKAYQSDSLPAPDAAALAQSDALIELIRAEIDGAGGWLPFDRYMERALYAPGLGYYSGGAVKFGRRAEDGSDFVTAPELSPLFAATLARPVAQALEASGTRHVMEFGAGTGKLAAGLLNGLDALDVPFDSYSIVDLSGELRERQRETIGAEAPGLAARVRWLDALPEQFEGVLIGNEVLDAMPVRLFSHADGMWRERGVAWRKRHPGVRRSRRSIDSRCRVPRRHRNRRRLRHRNPRRGARVHAHDLHDADARRGLFHRLWFFRATSSITRSVRKAR